LKVADPFCADRLAREFLARTRRMLRAAGFEPSDGDQLVLGAFAASCARLQEIAERLAVEDDPAARLRLMRVEREGRTDFVRQLALLERLYADREPDAEGEPVTGLARVVPFMPRLSRVAQRVVEAVQARPGLTKEQFRKRVKGGQGEFLSALREAAAVGAIERVGRGVKGSGYRYRPGIVPGGKLARLMTD
jgi:hypothetical protein